MQGLREVVVPAMSPQRLEPVLGVDRFHRLLATAEDVRAALDQRAVLHVSSTASGGGVAEMLYTLLSYVRGLSVDTRWFVLDGDPEFFAVTKRIHNRVYGAAGDTGALGAAERVRYENDRSRRTPRQGRPGARPGAVPRRRAPGAVGAHARRRAAREETEGKQGRGRVRHHVDLWKLRAAGIPHWPGLGRRRGPVLLD